MSRTKMGHATLSLRARLLFIGVAVLVGLGLAEIGVRTVRPQPSYYPRYLYLEDPDIGYRLRPRFHGILEREEFRVPAAINSLGFRGPEVALEKGRAPRVLFLGDSMTFGWGVTEEQSFAALLRGRFPGVEIINGGVPAYGTVHQLAFYPKYGARLRPDVVVLVFNENDMRDNFSGITRTVVGGYLVPVSSKHTWIQWSVAYAADALHVVHLTTEQMRSVAAVYKTIRDDGPRVDPAVALDVTRRSLTALAEAVRGSGARLAIAFVSPSDYAAFAPMLRALGVASVNLDEAVSRERDVTFPRDLHWTPRGHAVVADRLARWLAEQGVGSMRPWKANHVGH